MSKFERSLLDMHKTAEGLRSLCTEETMRQFKLDLKRIGVRLADIEAVMRNEARICSQELEERLELGLAGDAAIKHYNDFMNKNQLFHLMIQD